MSTNSSRNLKINTWNQLDSAANNESTLYENLMFSIELWKYVLFNHNVFFGEGSTLPQNSQKVLGLKSVKSTKKLI